MRRKSIALTLAVIMLAVLSFPTIASGNQGLVRKIVVFNKAVNEPARDALIKKFGGVKVKDLNLIEGKAVLLPPKAVVALKKEPGVLRVDDDIVFYATGKRIAAGKKAPTQPPESLQWGVDRIDADLAWATSTAAGVKVAILDTGIDLDHPDLGANVKGGINTINPRKKPDDDNGHGSHVAGVVAAVRGNGIGVIGVGPNASLYAVKVLGASGSGYASDVIEGLDWCIQNGIKVVNMSFGASSDNQSIHDAVIRAYNAGIIMVAAAGNSGPGSDTVSYPARYNEVIAVAATDSNDAVAPWSSRGPEVDIAAPGVNIYSTYKNAGYATMSGTSMAAPHVTGAIALKLQVNPLLSPDATRSLVMGTAEPILGVPEEVGAGLIDAEALVNAQ